MPELYRPFYHFTPPSMWMNDPNGLVYANGQYHMFYQYHPDSTEWGPMHWGHATSPDMVNWQHRPVALAPDELGTIFSGSAVVDWQNAAGFGAGVLVAFFTYHGDGQQRQGLAYSTNSGATWVKYAHNPILHPPANRHDFRDPKVFWYSHGTAGHWVMSLVAGHGVLFYTSSNLINWTPGGSFGFAEGNEASIWETPDLFELPIEGSHASRWVLALGVLRDGPVGGSGTCYFIGDFDGYTFTPATPVDTPLWADFGADFYATQSWSDEPHGRRIWIGWMSNWQYANLVPTGNWRGAFTVPRVLSLAQTPAGLRLRQQPIAELADLRSAPWQWREQHVEPGAALLAGVQAEAAEIVAELVPAAHSRVSVRVLLGAGEATTIGYDADAGELFVDRTQAGASTFFAGFASRHSASLAPVDGVVRLRILVDRSSVEVFGNDGALAITEQVFPSPGSTGIDVLVEGAPVLIRSLDVYPLAAASFAPAPTG